MSTAWDKQHEDESFEEWCHRQPKVVLTPRGELAVALLVIAFLVFLVMFGSWLTGPS